MGSALEHQGQPVTILHFNDVYHISNSDLVARFASVFADPSLVADGDAHVAAAPTLRVFSGDAFSPSLEAAVLRGEHMTPVLNGLGIDVACYGNHDFDFGEERLVELASQTKFPWTLANVVGNTGSRQEPRLLAGAREYVVKKVGGYSIGFFGLAGSDWPSNCQHLPECTIADPSMVARRVASHLRRVEKCDLVIAVTHMRLVEDLAVAADAVSADERVDLVLGGHDHHVLRRVSSDGNSDPQVLQTGFDHGEAPMTDFEGHLRIVKSGTDWRGLSLIRLYMEKGRNGKAVVSNMSVKQISDLAQLPNYHEIVPLPKMLKTLETTHKKIETLVTQPLLYTNVPLEGRTRIIRRQETNLGNMLADALRAFYATDIALVNSGAIRCDCIVKCVDGSPLSIHDAINISPFDNALIVKSVSGRVLATALENSVSDAHTDGRFLQVSGLSMTLDWRRPEGRRLSNIAYTSPNGTRQPLEDARSYTVAMVDFIGSGFDGYSCFKDAETLIDAEEAITDTSLLLEIFKAGSKNKTDTEIDDGHTQGINRARRAIISGHHEVDGLPIVKPALQDRIKVVSESNL
ncbi:hypothetical protein CDD81_1760 [Ophiocordyceps australis]|uniref:5'-Nucleotidase C-terminal domain-containing protein n=1 Tax=Ophiocordyceps australis TaxID=1399860 RepID=A0A2C5YFC1_9HYPO|nr:hypothetical protein CDD81_1760 [Ophiocordyceps australis]